MAFKPLVQIYRRQLYSYLFKLSRSREEAEDLMQIVLIKIWKGITRYSEQQKFSSWLFTIAHNVAMDNLRKRNKEMLITAIEPDELENSSNPHKELVESEIKAKINKAVELLSMKQKEVFLLRINGGLTFKEISGITKEPMNTVLSHMNYSIKKIKNYLGREDEQ